jgi:negative regulator of sigma E activity
LVKANLPFGFQLESQRQFHVQGETVTQRSYSDGLAVVSVFETHRPVQVPANTEKVALGEPQFLNVSIPARVVHGRRKNLYITIIGDGSKELLEELWRQIP